MPAPSPCSGYVLFVRVAARRCRDAVHVHPGRSVIAMSVSELGARVDRVRSPPNASVHESGKPMRTCVLSGLLRRLLRCGILILACSASAGTRRSLRLDPRTAQFRVQVGSMGDRIFETRSPAVLTPRAWRDPRRARGGRLREYKLPGRIADGGRDPVEERPLPQLLRAHHVPLYARVEILRRRVRAEESRPQVRTILSGAEEIVSHWIQTGATADPHLPEYRLLL